MAGIDSAIRSIETDKSLADSQKDSLLAIAARRIDEMVEFRLSQQYA
jgi:hypothetical protein